MSIQIFAATFMHPDSKRLIVFDMQHIWKIDLKIFDGLLPKERIYSTL